MIIIARGRRTGIFTHYSSTCEMPSLVCEIFHSFSRFLSCSCFFMFRCGLLFRLSLSVLAASPTLPSTLRAFLKSFTSLGVGTPRATAPIAASICLICDSSLFRFALSNIATPVYSGRDTAILMGVITEIGEVYLSHTLALGYF